MTTMQTIEWYLHFKSGQTSVEYFENSGYPLSRYTDDNLEKVHYVIHMDQWHMINNVIRHIRQDVGRKHQDNWCTSASWQACPHNFVCYTIFNWTQMAQVPFPLNPAGSLHINVAKHENPVWIQRHCTDPSWTAGRAGNIIKQVSFQDASRAQCKTSAAGECFKGDITNLQLTAVAHSSHVGNSTNNVGYFNSFSNLQ
jgi:hypothetical protein